MPDAFVWKGGINWASSGEDGRDLGEATCTFDIMKRKKMAS